MPILAAIGFICIVVGAILVFCEQYFIGLKALNKIWPAGLSLLIIGIAAVVISYKYLS
jgi:hypothetical protein